MISSEARDAVLAAVDLAEIVEEAGTVLRRAGSTHVGLCPFHAERTPSFAVYEDHFHCFGCGAHGTAIDLAMQVLGYGFREAMGWLALRAGIPLDGSRPLPPRRRLPARRARDPQTEIEAQLRKLGTMRDVVSVRLAAAPHRREAALDLLSKVADQETRLHAALANLDAERGDHE